MRETLLLVAAVGLALAVGYRIYTNNSRQNAILREMIRRLEADTRIAEVIVTDVHRDPDSGLVRTRIKFVEYDALNRPLPAKFFNFNGNVIQFQSLVIRFDDLHIKEADPFKGKSAYLFLKAFRLDGRNTEEYVITEANEIPRGYRIRGEAHPLEQRYWSQFWDYALRSKTAVRQGIKNAQIEAPGMKFLPGYLYTLKIEHDGGIRIDAQEIPHILKGEKILE